MEHVIEQVVGQFESGRITRRQLVAQLSALALLGSASARAEESAMFKSTGLNHIALRVTDVARSKDFYVKHLGMTVVRDSADSCFLTFGNAFVALFKGDKAEMDHVCFAVEGYNVAEAEKKLKDAGLEVEQPKGTGRIYFKDPDGLTLQLSAPDHMA